MNSVLDSSPRVARPGPRGTFLSSLRYNDLRRLRGVAKRIMADLRYPQHLRNDREADRMIEAYGERAAQALIKTAVDRGVIA